MSDNFSFSKRVDMSNFGDSCEVKITRFTKDGSRRKESKYNIESQASLNRLETVLNSAGKPEIDLYSGTMEIVFYFKWGVRLSDYLRQALLDRAISNRKQREAMEARKAK